MSNRSSILDVIKKTQVNMTMKRASEVQKQAAATPSATSVASGSLPALPSQGSTINVPTAKSLSYVAARDNRQEFFSVWSRKIQMFVDDSTRSVLKMPAELTANDRRELHTLATKFNLSHHSEGVGKDRHLVLKKDELHFKGQPQRVDQTSLDNILTTNNAGGRGHHRHRDEKKPVVADKDAIKAFNKLMRATDQYSHAVDSAYTVEELMGQQQQAGQAEAPATGSSDLWNTAMATTVGEVEAEQRVEEQPSGEAKRKREDDESNDVAEDEYKVTSVAAAAAGDQDVLEAKRVKKEEAAASDVPTLETLTLEDAVSMARLNDMEDPDVEWIENKFAKRFHAGETLELWLQFAIDFEEAILPAANEVEQESLVLLKETRSEVKKEHVSVKLEKLFAALDEESAKRAIVILPGISLYGDELVCAVFIYNDLAWGKKAAGWLEGAGSGIQVGGRDLLKNAI